MLVADATYGQSRTVEIDGTRREWIPLTHPGNRTTGWVALHREWAAAPV